MYFLPLLGDIQHMGVAHSTPCSCCFEDELFEVVVLILWPSFLLFGLLVVGGGGGGWLGRSRGLTLMEMLVAAPGFELVPSSSTMSCSSGQKSTKVCWVAAVAAGRAQERDPDLDRPPGEDSRIEKG